MFLIKKLLIRKKREKEKKTFVNFKSGSNTEKTVYHSDDLW